MTPQELHPLRFPVGEFSPPPEITPHHRSAWINEIAAFPQQVRDLTKHLDQTQKAWVYRPGGWSIRQLVHHCADSHMNSLIRFKLALTEESPDIRPYYEDRWAQLADGNSDNLEDSLLLLTGLHAKWVRLLNSLTAEQWQREFVHPEHGQRFSLDENAGIYAWHCRHHLAHIQLALDSQGTYN
ncbi:UNVERIFIED_CONTAM: hypothetical protein GTU68_061038 [Idotea baltica]|nr:hypothetical protein [Idotea baltica]